MHREVMEARKRPWKGCSQKIFWSDRFLAEKLILL